jgi:environmental stress-induced protein Ves
MGMPRFARYMGWLALLILLAACSNGSGSLEEPVPPPPAAPAQGSFSIGGSVTGLVGRGLVLQNSGAGDLSIASDGSFNFAATVPTGAAYNVTVLTQPSSPAQRCTVANGSGTVASGNVTGVSITCSTEPRFSVGGTVTGLLGTGLVLQNNNADDLAVNANGTFTFATALADAATYSVTVRTQPTGQNCVVTNAVGTIAAADVATIALSCATNQFTVGGTVTGLKGSGLTLRVNGGNNLRIVNDGPFAFPMALANSATYEVDVLTQPSSPSQDCMLTNPKGTIAGANVTNIALTCTTKSFTVGGTVSGLAGKGLVLRLNGGAELRIQSNGAFTFAAPVLSGATYEVRVEGDITEPTQICTAQNARGTMRDARITDVNVTCATQTYTVRGTITGLLGTGLKLRNNGGDEITIAANTTTFVFPTKVASGGSYNVTISASPAGPTQACSVQNGSGKVVSSEISTVAISCSTSNFTIGGNVQNLTGTLILRNNNGDDLTMTASGPFTFATAIPSGSTYSVSVAQNPIAQRCDVTSGSGTVGGTNVASVVVQCTTTGYFVGGTVAGLVGQGLVLQNNGADDLPIAADGSFTFATPLAPTSPYSVRVVTAPPFQFCYVTNGDGQIAESNVQNVGVHCQVAFIP